MESPWRRMARLDLLFCRSYRPLGRLRETRPSSTTCAHPARALFSRRALPSAGAHSLQLSSPARAWRALSSTRRDFLRRSRPAVTRGVRFLSAGAMGHAVARVKSTCLRSLAGLRGGARQCRARHWGVSFRSGRPNRAHMPRLCRTNPETALSPGSFHLSSRPSKGRCRRTFHMLRLALKDAFRALARRKARPAAVGTSVADCAHRAERISALSAGPSPAGTETVTTIHSQGPLRANPRRSVAAGNTDRRGLQPLPRVPFAGPRSRDPALATLSPRASPSAGRQDPGGWPPSRRGGSTPAASAAAAPKRTARRAGAPGGRGGSDGPANGDSSAPCYLPAPPTRGPLSHSPTPARAPNAGSRYSRRAAGGGAPGRGPGGP